jgi:hypothetical protein
MLVIIAERPKQRFKQNCRVVLVEPIGPVIVKAGADQHWHVQVVSPTVEVLGHVLLLFAPFHHGYFRVDRSDLTFQALGINARVNRDESERICGLRPDDEVGPLFATHGAIDQLFKFSQNLEGIA